VESKSGKCFGRPKAGLNSKKGKGGARDNRSATPYVDPGWEVTKNTLTNSGRTLEGTRTRKEEMKARGVYRELSEKRGGQENSWSDWQAR